MEIGGWILLTLSWACIISLVMFCMRRVLRDEASKD